MTLPPLFLRTPPLLAAAMILVHAAEPSAPASVPVLTRAADIRQLSAEQAGQRRPVRLRGVALDYYETDPGSQDYALFIHDGSASIYIDGAKNGNYGAGQLLEIDGVTAAGEFAPMVVMNSLRIVGEGEIPAARDVSYERLATGAEDGQWVRVRGIVRSASFGTAQDHRRAFVELSTGSGRLRARIEDFDGGGSDLQPDAEVSVTGVCIPLFNRQRQLIGMRLSLPNVRCLQIDRPAPEEPFAMPLRTVNSLMRFAPNENFGHRVKVRGTVTLQQFGGALFIQDETQGLWVKTRQKTRVVPGDQLEVLGFPVIGEYTPVMEDAIFRLVDSGPPLSPLAVTVAQARDGDCDAALIQLDAQLLERQQTPKELVLVLQDKDIMFRAHLERNAADRDVLAFDPGARVRLTGVCQVQRENQRWPQSFRLLLRAPGDVVLLRAAPWWNLRRLLWALGAMGIVIVIAVLWIVTLRRRVRAQTETIKRDVQRTTVLEERARLAREFHDTLEQELAGIRIQLDTIAEDMAELPEHVKRNFNVTRLMVRHSESEARRSVWDLRTAALENGDLPAALSAIAVQAKDGQPTHVETAVLGERYPLAGWIESHLLRIAQEGTANALRHAEAKNIRIELYYEPKMVRLCVRDDGHGFVADNATSSEAGHFGLLGMRERVDKLGGALAIFSAPAHGTIIEVKVPVAEIEFGSS